MKRPNLKIILFLGLLSVCFLAGRFIYQTLDLAKAKKEIEENQLPPELDLQTLQQTLSSLENRLDLTRETTPAMVESKEEILSVEIINASGIDGAAAGIKADLETKGFTVPAISTALSLVDGTSILAKPGIQETTIALIKEVLAEEFLVFKEGHLEENYFVDISIILGRR